MPRDGTKRKISYAIQPQPSYYSRSSSSRRVPQLVGLGAFIGGALIISIGLIFGIGPSFEVDVKNSSLTDDRSEEKPYLFKRGCKKGTVKHRYATVVTNSPICSTVGTDILARKRATVVDAAITTLLCLGVVSPHNSGLGGGFYMVYYKKSKDKVYTLDARETAPSYDKQHFSKNNRFAASGGRSIGVPGELRGYRTAHDTFGNLQWKDLFQPVIKMVESGIRIRNELFNAMKDVKCAIEENPAFGKDFINLATRRLKMPDERLYRPNFLKTLQILAREGDTTFYDGHLADEIVSDIRDAGGNITESDLQYYEALWRAPVKVDVKNGSHTLYTTPSPSVGPVLALGLNLLTVLNTSLNSFRLPPQKVKSSHLVVETLRQAKVHMQELGDLSSQASARGMLTSPTYARQVQGSRMSTDVADDTIYKDALDPGQTAVNHVNIIGADGDIVSVSSSLTSEFGSRVVGKRTGIIFNNANSAFNHKPSPPTLTNSFQPGKRPLSQLSPVILFDNYRKEKLCLGAIGDRLLSVQIQVIMRYIFLNETIEKAAQYPRLYTYINPSKVLYGKRTPPRVSHGLRVLGHRLSRIWQDKSSYIGAKINQEKQLTTYVDYGREYCSDGY